MDVLGINNISEPKDSGRIKKAQNKKTDNASADKNSVINDNVVISEAAKSALKDRSYVNMVNELPEVRKELIEKAKSEISNGSLFSEEIMQKTADKLINGIVEETFT